MALLVEVIMGEVLMILGMFFYEMSVIIVALDGVKLMRYKGENCSNNQSREVN